MVGDHLPVIDRDATVLPEHFWLLDAGGLRIDPAGVPAQFAPRRIDVALFELAPGQYRRVVAAAALLDVDGFALGDGDLVAGTFIV